MQITCSKYTPGVKGYNVGFEIGEIVKYQLASGDVIDIRIDSPRMTHNMCKTYGFEAIFSDDGKRYFADGEKIVGWEGKVNTMEEFNNLCNTKNLEKNNGTIQN